MRLIGFDWYKTLLKFSSLKKYEDVNMKFGSSFYIFADSSCNHNGSKDNFYFVIARPSKYTYGQIPYERLVEGYADINSGTIEYVRSVSESLVRSSWNVDSVHTRYRELTEKETINLVNKIKKIFWDKQLV